MILLLLMICIVVLLVHYRLAPRKSFVHAAEAKDFPDNLEKDFRVPTPRVYRIKGQNKFLSRKGKFYGQALGSSMEEEGIPDGAEFFGDRLPESLSVVQRLELLEPNLVVVVDGPHQGSKTGKRLRKISSISPCGQVKFFRDGKGKKRRNRPISEVVAVVTHVVP